MKRTYLVILVFILLCGSIVISPQLLNIDIIRSKVVTSVTQKTGWTLETDQFQWRWMPLPHFVLRDTSITKAGIKLDLPETKFFPLWSSLFKGNFEFGRIVLVSPLLDITEISTLEKRSESNLTIGIIQIEDGRISLPGKFLATKNARSQPAILNEINGKITLREQIDFDFEASSSVSDIVDIEGSFDTSSNKFIINYEVVALEVQKLIPSLLNGKIVPFRSKLSLRGQLQGKGTERFIVSAEGDFPCFALPPDPDSLFLDCGTVSLIVEKDRRGLLISINELELKNPGMILSGRIGKILDDENSGNGELNNSDPLWLIDLSGKDLDLTAIRNAVLTLWGDNEVAQIVCDIVRGGNAKTASYYFKAPLGGFKDIRNMTIKAEADNALILPPETNLHLTEASGPIEISKGFLTGSGLHASLGESRGKNGSLLLDLSDSTDTFKLDLDIDADISALPQVLIDLVNHDGFQKETRLFSNTQGRAKGHLKIGESLNDLKVDVNVDSMDINTHNSHIPWPIHINSGKLTVAPEEVAWTDAKGSLGPNLIHKFSGSVNWQKDIELSILSLDSSIDSNSFFHKLADDGNVPEKILQNLTNVEGPVNVRDFSLNGKANDPESWTYSMDIASKGSRWTSKLLPYPVLAENMSLTLTQDTVITKGTKLWFLEQAVSVDGDLKHNKLSDWQGWLKFNGTVRETFAKWLKGREFFPDKYFPKLPCTLKDFKIEWDFEKFMLDGTIASGMGAEGSPFVRINLENNNEKFLIKELVVSSEKEIGKLNLEHSKNERNDFKLNWQGFISASTVKKLLPSNIIRAEHVEGDFSLRLPFTRGRKPFIGWIKTSEYKKPDQEDLKGFSFKKLDISTNNDGSINIKPSLFVSVGNELEISGKVDLTDNKIDLDLDLKAKKINKESIIRIVDDLKKSSNDPENQNPKTNKQPFQISGRVDFQADRFESSTNPEDKNTSKEGHLGSGYVFSPIKGYVTFHPKNNYSLNIRSSKICGLNISGLFNSDSSIGENSFNIYTDSSSPPMLQDTLPCFGVKQDLLEGPLHVDINVTGKDGKWTEGKANIYSEKGFIRRLGFLAKTFSIINLTDLFQENTLPDASESGFTYSRFDIQSHIKNNEIIIENAVLKGSGLNLFTEGKYNIGSHEADLTMMVAPLKTVDAIVTNIPLIGKIAGGADKALISIPVRIKGDLRDPDVTLLPPGAIGQGLLNIIANTITLPFTIFSPESTGTSP